MKKLMIALAAVAVGFAANAASFTWKATSGYLYDGADTPAKITSGTAYLMFVTSAYTQADLVSAYYAADGDSAATLTAMSASGALASGSGTIGDNARIDVTASTSTLAGADGTVYFVVFNDDKMYVSITADSLYDAMSGEAEATFGKVTTSSKLSLDAGADYSSAGWYTAAVPEPTSGLLLLVGAAMLALKRKRA